MRQRNLNTINTMKKLVLLLAMIFALSTGVKAQTSLVATLSHDGNVTTFCSANGLKDAYAAAVDGDIITLSPGSFVPVDISKNIIVRGAGMDINDNATIINGNLQIASSSDPTQNSNVSLEGIYVNGCVYPYKSKETTTDNWSFIKCHFKKFESREGNYSYLNNGVFVNCIFDELEIYGQFRTTASFINCIIEKLSSCGPTSAVFNNCYIVTNYSVENSAFINCIFYSKSINAYLSSSCTASYCYSIGPNLNFFKYTPNSTNSIIDPSIEVFKDSTTYELTDELASTWLGNDGTQVGIYGGTLPFNPVPSNPRITKFNVAPKTTADGKLSVEIEVKSN